MLADKQDEGGVKRGRGVVVQFRIHSFRRWPVSIRFYSAAKNVYDEHHLTTETSFWRCDHGLTGFGEGFEWMGCWRCALWRPIKAFKLWWSIVRGESE